VQYGGTFPDEIRRTLSHDQPGSVSMDTLESGPNSNGSRFRISLPPAPDLDGRVTLFGRIAKTSLPILEEIGALIVGRRGRPKREVQIYSAVVIDDPWEGDGLPQGCIIPEKPLVVATRGKGKKDCALQ
jgi:cyclophilin family peptidyl-prolyl cis-trans isomerase